MAGPATPPDITDHTCPICMVRSGVQGMCVHGDCRHLTFSEPPIYCRTCCTSHVLISAVTSSASGAVLGRRGPTACPSISQMALSHNRPVRFISHPSSFLSPSIRAHLVLTHSLTHTTTGWTATR